MQCRSYASRRTEGFVLLYTLWLMLGGVALFAAVSALSMQRARATAADASSLRLATATESAAHEMMFKLVARGHRSLAAAESQDLTIDGVRLRAALVHSAGLVDLNNADDDSLERVLSAVGARDPAALARAVRQVRPVHSYAQLAVVDDLDLAMLGCLLRYATLSSGRSRPLFELAPEHVRTALGLTSGSSGGSGVTSPDSIAGGSVRLVIETVGPEGAGRRLLVDLLVTGRLDRPVAVLDWEWRPTAELRLFRCT